MIRQPPRSPLFPYTPLFRSFDARRPEEAVARVRSYLHRGYSSSRLLDVLANYACRDSAVANGGINLILADVGATEFLASKDRKSTRLNSRHSQISYAVFCLK